MISIHAPRAGCDEVSEIHISYSRISIHAPRAGCDGVQRSEATPSNNFNPRTPCGVRPFMPCSMVVF